MDAKKLFSNKSMCVLPWTGFQLEPSGKVRNCITSQSTLGNINSQDITDILNSDRNKKLKQAMLDDTKPSNCATCHLQELHRNDPTSISSRLYYLKEIGAKTGTKLYDSVDNFDLRHVDLRWTNSCNQACVYCAPFYSSKWAQELNVVTKSNKEARQRVKDFVYDKIDQIENIYLAGGEPMLMKENIQLLELLKEKNPNCNIRVNTNLSKTNTGIFDLICWFKNVHWTVSIEATGDEYEYIRYGGSWSEFSDNIDKIKGLGHKITFNMLHFILNHKSIFECVAHLKSLGFEDNSFVIGPLYTPMHYNILNLPDAMIDSVTDRLRSELDKKPTGYLLNSYENLLHYYTSTVWQKQIKNFYEESKILDQRRNLDSRKIFKDLYEELDANTLE